jgi:hypothetical protein
VVATGSSIAAARNLYVYRKEALWY